MNNITICGNLTKDAELRFMPTGDPVASFAIADNQGKDKSAIFWNCSLFGKRSESLAQYLTKGQSVTVIGNVTEREWTDKEGNKRKSMDVRVADVALQGGRREDAPAPQARPAPKPAARASAKPPEEMPYDDVPF